MHCLRLRRVTVTIHRMDEGVDTGDILLQEKVTLCSDDTLRSSYDKLQVAILQLFARNWVQLRSGNLPGHPQVGSGSVHRLRDKERYAALMVEKGWATPISTLAGKAVAV